MALVMLLYPGAGDCLGLDANQPFAKYCFNFCNKLTANIVRHSLFLTMFAQISANTVLATQH
jgi:hypothetical protein